MYTQHLVENGVDVTVICGKEDDSILDYEKINGVNVYRILTDLSTSISYKPTVFGYRALKKVDELMNETEINILHIRSFPNLGLILTSVPWLDSPSTSISDVRGTAISNPFFETLSRVGIRVQDLLVDETIVIDEKVSDRIFSSRSDVSILPLGVDLSLFTPEGESYDRTNWGFKKEDIIIGYTGNLHSSKGIGKLVDSFIQAKRKDSRLRLVIIGSGPAKKVVKEKVSIHNLSDSVILVGEVDFEKIPNYLRTFDIGAAYIPNKPQFRNQPPLKTVEFLACGLPIVATNTPGNLRFATPDTNGIIVSDEVESFSSGILRLSENEKLRHQLGQKSRESISDYDYEKIVTEYLIPIYEKTSEKNI
jgi:glycosyltransferase involved in cell wall biosynthesis